MFDDYVSTENINDFFVFHEVVGQQDVFYRRGAYAEVKKAIHIEEGKPVAIKCIDKKRLASEDLKIFKNECQIMISLDHPNIVQVYEVYDNADYFYIVMQYMKGGQLYDQKNLHRCKTQAQICQIIKNLTDALDFCHSKNVVHRDIKVSICLSKPENILWSTNDNDAILKITDFGFAKMSTDSLLTTACGTPKFFAPQILERKPYTKAVDFWSLGIITYILLSGRYPFEAEDQDQLFRRIIKSKLEFPSQYWKYISTSAKEFVGKLLQKNYNKRYGAEQIKRHPWINADHTDMIEYIERQQNIWQLESERKIEKMRTIINITLNDMKRDDSRLDSSIIKHMK